MSHRWPNGSLILPWRLPQGRSSIETMTVAPPSTIAAPTADESATVSVSRTGELIADSGE